MGLWGPLISGAFNEGMSRALAGDAGTLQDHSQSSYAAAFTEEEYWLSMDDTRRVIQRKSTALNILAPAAKLRLGDQAYLVARVDPLEDVSAAALGTILDQSEQGFILQVADGAVRVQATRMQPA